MKQARGFTLIEAVLTILIISIGLFAMMILFDNVTRSAMEGDFATTATYLARERLERMVFDKVYKGYNYIAAGNYPASEAVLIGSQSYTRLISILEVSKNNLSVGQTGSGFKRIDVSVRWGGGAEQRINETTLVTSY
jgi:Tfp pilus assembly protein PilV